MAGADPPGMSITQSPLFRIAVTSALVVVLQLPVALIASTIEERRLTRNRAFEEVTRTWGGAQEIAGPLLDVPATDAFVDNSGRPQSRLVTRHFVPKTLVIRARAETEVRHRGIFDVPLYVAALHVEGTLDLGAGGSDSSFTQASLSFGVSDAKAIRSLSALAIDGQHLDWEPGPAGDLLASGVHAPLAALRKSKGVVPFSFDLVLAGSGRLAFVPAGDDTSVALESSWADPSFDGASLPADRSVGEDGFAARWQVLRIGRNFPSSWTDKQIDQARLSASSFGVSLLSPVDTYRINERAVKYQLLFLGLTFVCFMLVELLARLRVHPVQYLMVGLALCVFYLLLLSLSEQIGFGRAYLIAASATVWLVTMYVRFVLDTAARALTIGGFLSGLYGFLFVLLQIQDYALLVGSVGLFATLGTVMWLTRRVDWFELPAAKVSS